MGSFPALRAKGECPSTAGAAHSPAAETSPAARLPFGETIAVGRGVAPLTKALTVVYWT